MTISTNFNVSPYYDDFSEDKKFLRMLFKPGYAVQARELTQSQTILQKQIEKFGNHIFENGSVVTGGTTYLQDVTSLKLNTDFY
jgi:myosin-crossreactive antigen